MVSRACQHGDLLLRIPGLLVVGHLLKPVCRPMGCH